jgi:organic hydroperoxide reductase OsmC/OhrA
MKAYPHEYRVAATAAATGEVLLSSEGLDELRSAPPVEFDGPGDRWSPETLLVAAIADCFVLTFRAIARATRLPWQALDCDVTGTLAREQGQSRFTNFDIRARLTIPTGVDEAQARAAMEKAEHGCLISNSLNGEVRLATEVVVA